VASFTIDSDRSSVTAVTRPRLTNGPGASVHSVAGTVDLDGEVVVQGALTVTLDGDGGPTAVIDLSSTPAELSTGPEGETVLVGRVDRPAGAFGLAGPPLLNPTLQLRWRLVLLPA